MKIPTDNREYGVVECRIGISKCNYTRTCANHRTAGDFRSEDGFTPRLRLVNNEVVCDTVHYENKPLFDRDYPKEHHDCGATLWKELI